MFIKDCCNTCGGDGFNTFVNDGEPSDALGENGDVYIDCSTGDVYFNINGIWVFQCQIGGQDVFGNFYQYAENTTPLGTVSASFAQYLNLTTPAIPAGDYRIGLVFNYEATTAATVGEYRIQVDNSIILPDLDIESLGIASSGERKSFSNFFSETLTAGVHSIDVDIRRSAGAGTFTIDDAKLEIWRVS